MRDARTISHEPAFGIFALVKTLAERRIVVLTFLVTPRRSRALCPAIVSIVCYVAAA